MPATLKMASARVATKKTPAKVGAQKKERGVKVGIDRFEKLLRLARRRSGATMEELKRELEVSQASVKRDIDFLRTRMGCPIEWDPQKHRYFVRDLPDGGRFELPGLWFDASEILALLMMLHLVEGMEPGMLVQRLRRARSCSLSTSLRPSSSSAHISTSATYCLPFTWAKAAVISGNHCVASAPLRERSWTAPRSNSAAPG